IALVSNAMRNNAPTARPVHLFEFMPTRVSDRPGRPRRSKVDQGSYFGWMPGTRARPYRLIMTMLAVTGYRSPLPVGRRGGANPDAVTRRSARDWLVDVLCFLLAIGVTTITAVDSIDQHTDPVPLAIDLTLGGLSCLGVWLRRRWPVGFAVTAGLFSVYAL